MPELQPLTPFLRFQTGHAETALIFHPDHSFAWTNDRFGVSWPPSVREESR